MIPLSLSLLFDLTIVLVLAFSIFLGWKQGIVRGGLTLISTILALILSSQAADYAAETVIDEVIRPATHNAIALRVNELRLENLVLSPLEELEQVISAIENRFVREEAQKLLSSVGLSPEIAGNAAKDSLLTMGTKIADTVLDGVVEEFLSTLLCVLCFTVLSLVVKPLIRMICKAFRLPVLRQIDQTGGLLLGAARGLLIIFIAVWALRLLGLWLNDDVIGQSPLLSLIAGTLDRLGLTPAAKISLQ